MEVTYDTEARRGYLYLRDPRTEVGPVTSFPILADEYTVILDFSPKDGTVAGIELPQSAFPPELLELLQG